jgi:hypothetical protein
LWFVDFMRAIPVPVGKHVPCTAAAVQEDDDAELQFDQEEP